MFFFQQLFEFEEDRMFKQALEDEEKKVEYVPNIGEWLKDSYDEWWTRKPIPRR